MHGYSDRINHAFAFAAKYHGAVAPVGAGMDYLAHPSNVAVILARYGCDQITIVAGILHHVLEESAPDKRPVLERKIADKFGPVALAVAKDALEPKFDRRDRTVIFGGKGERVIDPVGIAVHGFRGRERWESRERREGWRKAGEARRLSHH